MGTLAIITRLRDAIETTGAGLLRCDSRRAIAEQSMSAVDRCFQLEISGGRNQRQQFGDGYTTIHFDVSVTVGYFRGGGDAGGGDLSSINEKAGDDQALISDALLDSRNWDPVTTEIQEVTQAGGWYRSLGTRLNEYWTGAFKVEVRVPWLPV